ncbi:MAG: hypothetical protein DWQ37_21515 [Planctomycetota bacterium]|nr:MAG: hypothetical protein DWQ37_21515 [Planctomycetota bacterium]
MAEDTREELICAYLDDELSPEERAEVEQLLAENSQLRQLHDELAALRTAMQSLGEHKLEQDLAPAVLRQAEQSVLRGSDTKQATSEPTPRGPMASWWERGASWRRVVWPALALAAALAILVFDAGFRDQRELAQVEAPLQEDQGVAGGEAGAGGADRPGVGAEIAPVEPETESLEMRAQPAPPADQLGQSESFAVDADQMRQSGARKSVTSSRSGADGMPEALKRMSTDQYGTPASQVYEVPPEFIQDRSFEKLLDENKIKWVRLPESGIQATRAREAAPAIEAGRSALSAGQEQNQATYYLFTNQQQVDDVLATMPNRKLAPTAPLADEERDSNAAAAGESEPVKIMLIAPEANARPAVAAPVTPKE